MNAHPAKGAMEYNLGDRPHRCPGRVQPFGHRDLAGPAKRLPHRDGVTRRAARKDGAARRRSAATCSSRSERSPRGGRTRRPSRRDVHPRRQPARAVDRPAVVVPSGQCLEHPRHDAVPTHSPTPVNTQPNPERSAHPGVHERWTPVCSSQTCTPSWRSTPANPSLPIDNPAGWATSQRHGRSRRGR